MKGFTFGWARTGISISASFPSVALESKKNRAIKYFEILIKFHIRPIHKLEHQPP